MNETCEIRAEVATAGRNEIAPSDQTSRSGLESSEGTLPVTFVILTRNEERNLPACLDSLQGISDDIHVLDSGSDDSTVAIANARNVTVSVHPFQSFGSQRNWAIDHIPHRYNWVFHLDADERMTPALAGEIAQVLTRQPEEVGFFIPSKLLFGGQWLRRSGGYPNFQLRLFDRRRLRFVDHGHGQREQTTGRLGFLREPYLHDAFAKGVGDWLTKHVGYAEREAERHFSEAGDSLGAELKLLVRGSRIERRRALKSLSFRVPCRAWWRFLETLILKRAFLDGRSGLAYARMVATYEAMISVHLDSLRSANGKRTSEFASDSPIDDGRKASPRRPR